MKRYLFKPTLGASIITLIGVAILFGLGTWQVQRLIWKTELLQTIESRMRTHILIFPSDISSAENFDYTKGAVRGVFLHDYEFHLRPRKFRNQVGIHVLTPFRRLNGDIILVNRGFAGKGDIPFIQRPDGEIILNGILHQPDDRNRFTPLNTPGSKELYATDVDFIERETGINFTTPLVLYASEIKHGIPIGGQLRLDIANDHLEYSFFWYTMCVMLIFFYVVYFTKRIEE